ncbi:MAG: DUF2283 domain-containing protein [Chloroflexi bacterium]|nr:DUF2283 domain-containing protein [Chloroflexota bacterium]
MSKPSLNYDSEKDILYIVIREGAEHHFDEVVEGIVVEFDEDDRPIGIEIFDVSQVMASAIGRERLALALS